MLVRGSSPDIPERPAEKRLKINFYLYYYYDWPIIIIIIVSIYISGSSHLSENPQFIIVVGIVIVC